MKERIISSLFLSLVVLASSCTRSCDKASVLPTKVTEKEENITEPSVFFVTPSDGDKLASPVGIKMGVRAMTVRPALEDVNDKRSGHHHVLIDHPLGFIEEGQVVPVDPRHIHFGQGQTTAAVDLEPGAHTLTLQFADGAHRSYGKKLAATIRVTVLPSY